MLTTFERVAPYVTDVTDIQIGKCHKLIIDGQTVYAVENERGDRGLDGEIMEYAVRYDEEHGFTCTCPSGYEGFAHVKHASGVCKHCRWAVVAMLEERAYLADLATKQAAEEEQCRQDCEAGTRAHLLIINGQEASPREYARVMGAQPYPWTEAEIKRDQGAFAPRPFRLER